MLSERRLRPVTTLRPRLDSAARAAIAARTEALFRQSGALIDGHFQLKSGRHSERYLEKFRGLQDPAVTGELCGLWAARYRDIDGSSTIDVVAGPTTGGIILAFETARQLGVRGIFAEEVAEADGSTRREFRRGFRIEPGERVLLVDDILTTGGSLLAMLPAVEAARARSSAATSWWTAAEGWPPSRRRPPAGSIRCPRCGRRMCRPSRPVRAPAHDAPTAPRSRCRVPPERRAGPNRDETTPVVRARPGAGPDGRRGRGPFAGGERLRHGGQP